MPIEIGVHAQAMVSKGDLVQDFQLLVCDDDLHILNVLSPAATASLAISENIIGQLPAC